MVKSYKIKQQYWIIIDVSHLHRHSTHSHLSFVRPQDKKNEEPSRSAIQNTTERTNDHSSPRKELFHVGSCNFEVWIWRISSRLWNRSVLSAGRIDAGIYNGGAQRSPRIPEQFSSRRGLARGDEPSGRSRTAGWSSGGRRSVAGRCRTSRGTRGCTGSRGWWCARPRGSGPRTWTLRATLGNPRTVAWNHSWVGSSATGQAPSCRLCLEREEVWVILAASNTSGRKS